MRSPGFTSSDCRAGAPPAASFLYDWRWKKASEALALQMLSNAVILTAVKDLTPLAMELRKPASVTTASNVRFLARACGIGMTRWRRCRDFARSYRAE